MAIVGVSRRTVLALCAVVLVFAGVAAVFWLIRFSKSPVGAATLAGGYLAAVGIALTVLVPLGSWWWKGRKRAGTQQQQLAAAAEWLAVTTADRWRLEAARRRIITPVPAAVRWHWADEDIAPARAEVATSPAPGTGPLPLPDLGPPGELLAAGVVTRLHDEVYARLPHGRLVLIGGPGAGKTAAMILLLLAALNRRASLAASDERERVPVPVWLTLGGWDPASVPLRDWAANVVGRDYPALLAPGWGPDVIGGLLRAGQLALFLDGLDELPAGMQPLALRRVDEEALGLRVVLTSRPGEYRSAVRDGAPANTAVIELRPVRPKWAADYLLHDQTGISRERWEQVAAYLMGNPSSIAARALDNPLALSLARDSYASQDAAVLADPARFTTVEALREHLIDQFLITAYPDERERERAIWWLAWIAHHMGSRQDLGWWEIPSWISTWKLRLACGLAAGLSAGLAAAAGSALISLGFPVSIAPTGSAVSAGIMAGLAVAVVAGLARFSAKSVRPREDALPRWRRLLGQWKVALIIMIRGCALAAALSLGLVSLLNSLSFVLHLSARTVNDGFTVAQTLVVGALILILLGLRGMFGRRTRLAGGPQMLVPRWPRRRDLGWIAVAGLAFFPLLLPIILGIWATPVANSPSSTVTGTYRIDRRASLAYGLVYGSVLGLLAGVWAGLAQGRQRGISYGLVQGPLVGISSGLKFALVAGLASFIIGWLMSGQYSLMKLTELLLISQRRGRIHFMSLLKDALDRQVLRQAGALCQFRHAAIQSRLASIHGQSQAAAGACAPPPALEARESTSVPANRKRKRAQRCHP
jgi:hypothetical protein